MLQHVTAISAGNTFNCTIDLGSANQLTWRLAGFVSFNGVPTRATSFRTCKEESLRAKTLQNVPKTALRPFNSNGRKDAEGFRGRGPPQLHDPHIPPLLQTERIEQNKDTNGSTKAVLPSFDFLPCFFPGHFFLAFFLYCALFFCFTNSNRKANLARAPDSHRPELRNAACYATKT